MKTAGRKPFPDLQKRKRVVQLYLTQQEWEAAKKAADGRPLASWLRRMAFERAGIQA